jgi:hypothetical protein
VCCCMCERERESIMFWVVESGMKEKKLNNK